MKFIVPEGYTAGMMILLDDEVVNVKDMQGNASKLEAVPGVPVCLMREGDYVFPKMGGGGMSLKVVGGTTKPAAPSPGTIWAHTDMPLGKVYCGSSIPEAEGYSEGDIFVASGPSNVEVASGDGRLAISPMYVIQLQGGVWTALAAVVWQDGVWQMFYPTYGLCLYCTGADYINQVDDSAGTPGVVMSIQDDETAGKVLVGTGSSNSYVSWTVAPYTTSMRRATLICAYKTDSTAENIFLLGYGAWSAGTNFALSMRKGIAGAVQYTTRAEGTISRADGEWHISTGLLDYEAGTIQLYEDGTQASTVAGTSLPTGSRVNIAAIPGTPAAGNGFVGRLAHQFIYNRAMTDLEVSCLAKTILNRVKGIF